MEAGICVAGPEEERERAQPITSFFLWWARYLYGRFFLINRIRSHSQRCACRRSWYVAMNAFAYLLRASSLLLCFPTQAMSHLQIDTAQRGMDSRYPPARLVILISVASFFITVQGVTALGRDVKGYTKVVGLEEMLLCIKDRSTCTRLASNGASTSAGGNPPAANVQGATALGRDVKDCTKAKVGLEEMLLYVEPPYMKNNGASTSAGGNPTAATQFPVTAATTSPSSSNATTAQSGMDSRYPLHLPLQLILFFLSLVIAFLAGQAQSDDTTCTRSHVREAINMGREVKFDDVKGCAQAKAELEKIVLYLKDPSKFTRLGGRRPRGLVSFILEID
jgi:hypothetical protein